MLLLLFCDLHILVNGKISLPFPSPSPSPSFSLSALGLLQRLTT